MTKDFYKRAKSCSRIISWFFELPNLIEDSSLQADTDDLSSYAVENIQEMLKKLGGIGNRFESELTKIEKLIKSDQSTKFEIAIKKLGGLLGFNAHRPLADGVPDSIWHLSNKLLLLFEAKSEDSEEGRISKSYCQQASGHYNWAEANVSEYEQIKEKLSIIISHRTKLENSAIPFVNNLYFIHIDRIREIFYEISGIIRRVRSHSITYEEEKIRQKIFDELKSKNLDPKSFINEIKENPISSLKST